MYTKTLKILLILIGIMGVLYVLFRGIIWITNPVTTPRTSLTQTAVIQELQSVNKLETASFTIEKIIEGGSEGNTFRNIIFGDTILLIAHGTVVGGFDLSSISTSSVVVSGTKLKIILPAPQILYSKLDNTQTKVYDRKLGLLTKGDKDLESQVRSAAEVSIRQAACQEGVLDQASANLRQQLSKLFLSLGFTEVVFEIPKVVECH